MIQCIHTDNTVGGNVIFLCYISIREMRDYIRVRQNVFMKYFEKTSSENIARL